MTLRVRAAVNLNSYRAVIGKLHRIVDEGLENLNRADFVSNQFYRDTICNKFLKL